MKLGFWTLGMPAWSLEEIAANAVKFGYHGVDLRCTSPGPDGCPVNGGNVSKAMTVDEIADARAVFTRAGVEISSLLLYNRPGETDSDWGSFEEETAAQVDLAHRLGVPNVRVMIGTPTADVESHLAKLWSATQHALTAAPDVVAVFENHPGNASAKQLFEIAEKVADPRVGVELSPDHALVMQEDSVDLIERYSPYIHQISYADRALVQEGLADFDGRYYHLRYESCGTGEGDVPGAAIIDKLRATGFDGYVSLKWEKSDRFGQHLRPGEEELPRYVSFMEGLGIGPRPAARA